jgi:pimeloyl-ACP methyl ester carboxylesterase
MKLEDHPTVQRLPLKTEVAPTKKGPLDGQWLKQLVRDAGADDVGLTASHKIIRSPVHIVWGSKDWSRSSEREHDRSQIPSAQIETVENGGHFLPFDRPDAVVDLHMRIRSGTDGG